MERPQLPNELLQKIREVLAAGIARNIIAKALDDLQPQGIKGKENQIHT